MKISYISMTCYPKHQIKFSELHRSLINTLSQCLSFEGFVVDKYIEIVI